MIRAGEAHPIYQRGQDMKTLKSLNAWAIFTSTGEPLLYTTGINSREPLRLYMDRTGLEWDECVAKYGTSIHRVRIIPAEEE